MNEFRTNAELWRGTRFLIKPAHFAELNDDVAANTYTLHSHAQTIKATRFEWNSADCATLLHTLIDFDERYEHQRRYTYYYYAT